MQWAFLLPAPHTPSSYDFAHGIHASSSHTISLMILSKESTTKVADFASEADAFKEPFSDIDNNSMHTVHKWEY